MESHYIVAGSSSGIGLEITKRLLNEGNKVTGISRREVTDLGGNYNHLIYDFSDLSIPMQKIESAVKGIVYAPGSINLKPFRTLSMTDLQNEMNLNLFGAVKFIQNFLPNLKLAEKSSVLLFSTVAVQTGMPYHASIASAKGAIEGLTRSLAAELAPNTRVNAIAPSLTNTPLAAKLLSSPEKVEASDKRHPLGRVGRVEDIAAMASFLLSDETSWITGQIIHIDGGMSSVKLM